jgi:hypothetical protein
MGSRSVDKLDGLASYRRDPMEESQRRVVFEGLIRGESRAKPDDSR